MSDQDVVVWYGGNGYYVMRISATGRVVYTVRTGGWGLPSVAPPPKQMTLSADALAALRTLIFENAEALRALHPPMRNLVPDESTQKLQVNWDGLALEVEMLSNDWHKYPPAKACDSALQVLSARVSSK